MTLGLGRQLLYIDRDIYRRTGSHILIVGATGSGKTSSLMKVCYNLYKSGETVVWRDDANLEFFGFLDILPIKCFIPEGCELHYDHPNLEYLHYDHTKLRELFPRFKNDCLNVLLFDLYTLSHEVMVKFWVRFFQEIYRYKRVQIHEPWSLVIDELNDLAPGSRRGYIKDHLTLASNIYVSLKKFRKMNLRLVGTTHNFNDLHPPLRGQFNYYIFKSMRREMVPERFWRYTSLMEKMPIDQCIIVDRSGHFQILEQWTEISSHHLDPEERVRLKPVRIRVPFDGEITVEETGKRQRALLWRTRALRFASLLIRNEIIKDYKDLANHLGISESYAWRLFKRIEEGDFEGEGTIT